MTAANANQAQPLAYLTKLAVIEEVPKPVFSAAYFDPDGPGGKGGGGGGGGGSFEASWKDVDFCNAEFLKRCAKALKDLMATTAETVKGDDMNAQEHMVFHEEFEREMEKAMKDFNACMKQTPYQRESASEYVSGVIRSKLEDNVKDMLKKVVEDI
jgi:hypothetical protein